MSSPITTAEAIANLKQMIFGVSFTTNYCSAAAAALVVYEHIITFDHEVLAIWRYRITGPTTLLLFNRYALLLTAISNVFEMFTWDSDQISICEAQVALSNVTFILPVVIVAGLSALRVYAIAGRNWCWTLLALLTGLVPAATNTYLYISVSHPYVGYVFGIPQCLENAPFSDNAFHKQAAHLCIRSCADHVFRFLIVTRTCAIVSDLVVIVATWIYARPWENHVPGTQIKTPLMLVTVRDGTGYFIVLLILNTVQMATEQLSYAALEYFASDYISVFIPAFSAILISRFMFNLRRCIDQGDSTGSNDPSFVARDIGSRGSIEFGSRLIGNMGAPLDHSTSNSLLFDDDEPQEDIGYSEKLPVEQTDHVQRDGETKSDAENEVGAATIP